MKFLDRSRFAASVIPMLGLIFAAVPAAKTGLSWMLLDTGSQASYRIRSDGPSGLPSPFKRTAAESAPPGLFTPGGLLALAKIDFLVGLDQLKDRPFSFRGGLLVFEEQQPPSGWIRVPIFLSKRNPYIKLRIGGNEEAYLLDTGCPFPVTFHSLKTELPVFLMPCTVAMAPEHRFERVGVVDSQIGGLKFSLVTYIDDQPSKVMEESGYDGIISPTYFSFDFYIDLKRGLFAFDPSTTEQSILNTVIGAVTAEPFKRNTQVALVSSNISLLKVGDLAANDIRKRPLTSTADILGLFDGIAGISSSTYRYANEDGLIVSENLLVSRSPTIRDNLYQVQFTNETLVRDGIRSPGGHIFPKGTKVIVPEGSKVKFVVDANTGAVTVTVP